MGAGGPDPEARVTARQVAHAQPRELGVSPQQAETGAAALLPAILGGFQKQQAQGAAGGGLGGLLGGLLGGGQAAPSRGGLAGMLDANGNGNPLDDILGMAGKFMR